MFRLLPEALIGFFRIGGPAWPVRNFQMTDASPYMR